MCYTHEEKRNQVLESQQRVNCSALYLMYLATSTPPPKKKILYRPERKVEKLKLFQGSRLLDFTKVQNGLKNHSMELG